MKLSTALIAAFALSLSACGGSDDGSGPPTLALSTGLLVGTAPTDAPAAVFKGIPFAQPPVGELRWRAPQAVQPWGGTKVASSYGPACAQASGTGVTGNEDCLYLNVWTPEWPIKGPHPVMLWIFGGANYTGSPNGAQLDGAALARKGVVVVTTNFRVGAFGFMAHPALSAESANKSSGNYGLLDQLMALQWIQQNIAAFGGDPANVTIFGQSSGAFDIMSLMASPLAKGLFARAIAESGQIIAYDGPMPKSRAEAIGTSIATTLQAPQGATTLAYLRSLPPSQIIPAAAPYLPTVPGSDTGLLVNVDGWVLPSTPASVFASRKELPVPMIIGTNAREIMPERTWPGYTLDTLRQEITTMYGPFASTALNAYGVGNGGQGITDPVLGDAGAQFWTDIVQRCPANIEVNWHAAIQPTYQYQFERSIPGKESIGATHGSEIAFVFGNLSRLSPAPALTQADYAASEQMVEYWTNFAKKGDPNSATLPTWPRAGNTDYLAFTAAGPVAKKNLQPVTCGVYRDWALQHFVGISP
jgi:para-nitrobenzyl esterase